MNKELKDVTLAESSVTLRLAEIRRRCSKFLADPDALELTLEEPLERPDGTNPYNLGGA
jgi:hypothetical protein